MNPALVQLKQFNEEMDAAQANAETMRMVDKMLFDRGIHENNTGWCTKCSGSGEGKYDGSCCPVCKGKGV